MTLATTHFALSFLADLASESFTIHANSNSTDELRFVESLVEQAIQPLVVVNGVSYFLKDVIGDNSNTSLIPELLALSLPLPKPIIVTGLPKAGTSTIHDFFQRAGYRSSHWLCESRPGQEICGMCIHRAIYNSLPPLKSCGDYDVWAQLDVSVPPPTPCYFPQSIYLQELHDESPKATFILNRRNLSHWVQSVENYKDLAYSLMKCNGHGGPTPAFLTVAPMEGPQVKMFQRVSWMLWSHRQTQRVKDFVLKHPSHALVEIDIEDPATANYMAALFQTKAAFWGHANHNINSSITSTKMDSFADP
jgi:Sulfotransferase domain